MALKGPLSALSRADVLARTCVPLLVVVGRQDRLVRPRSLREIVAARPDAAVRVVDAPHLVLQTVPSVVDGWPPNASISPAI